MQVADLRVVTTAPATLVWQLVGNDGEPADPGTVLVTVRRADGTEIATGQATTGTGTAARTYTLTPAQTRQLDELTVDWKVGGDTYQSQTVAVVGGAYFSNAEMRGAFPGVRDQPEFSKDLLSLARGQVEDKVERWTHQAWVPRVSIEAPCVSSGRHLIVSFPTVRRVRTVEFVDGATGGVVASLSPAECAAIPASGSGLLYRPGGWSSAGDLVRVVYEHGANCPTPTLKAAAMRLCREVLAKSKGAGLPENAVSASSTELGWSMVLVTPGVRGAHTAIPDVNEAVDTHTFEMFGVG